MNGRREKARQGGWNGGFAPYGYYLKDNHLLIEETEAEAIRIIFDKFGNSDIGLGGVAKYLNLQGIKKVPRQNAIQMIISYRTGSMSGLSVRNSGRKSMQSV